jgi:hypothetical protein
MNSNARMMLEALQHSANENTRESARLILRNEAIGPKGRLPQELVTEGFFGDFLRAVYTGDYLAAFGAADCPNQEALLNILHARPNEW